MATTTLPRRQASGRGRWMGIGIVLIVVAIAAALALNAALSRPAPAGPSTVAVTRGEVVERVAGTGSVAAAREVSLPFQTTGTVAEVLVAEGDAVRAGQALARLDTRDLELQVASAEAALESARARLEQTRGGNATPEDVGASEAALASAEAQLRSAQAQLQALQSPSASSLSNAESSVRQAEIELQAQRDNSSAAKTRAAQDLQKATAALTQAQVAYATAKSNWEFVQETGQDPTNPETTTADGEEVKNKLNDTQRQQYYDSFAQAEAQLRSAEQSVAQAQVSFDNARQQEIANIQKAEAQLADARAQLEALLSPSSTDVAQRRAGVDQAQASVDQARANLAKLSAAGSGTDIRIQQAAVAQAEQSLAQARLRLEQATLAAPFDGVVTAVDVVAGSVVSGGSAVSLVDRDPLHVELRLSENDVAKVRVGQPVALTIDALRDWRADGVVSSIASAGESSNGVVIYPVRVDFPDDDERVLVGMTAGLEIETARAREALLVPNTALLPKGAGQVVQVPAADGRGVTEVEVRTGLSDGTSTEIVSGLKEGDRVVETPSVGQERQGSILPLP